MRGLAVVMGCALACGPGTPGGTESASATAGTVAESSSGAVMTGDASSTGLPTGSSTGGESSGGEPGDGLEQHGPCPNGDECSLCVQSEGASICGPDCPEYGPGIFRCPPSAVHEQSICPWDEDTPGVCLIMCGDVSDCPDPGMVCVNCPEPFTQACDALWGFTEKGPNICAWPAG